MFIVKWKTSGSTRRRFHVLDPDLARALVWAGKQLDHRILLQTPGGQIFGSQSTIDFDTAIRRCRHSRWPFSFACTGDTPCWNPERTLSASIA